MKPYETDDELERALFALDLEEPPQDLRSSILAATIYRPPLPVKPWELWLVGGIFALIVWLCVMVVRGGAAPALSSVGTFGSLALAFFSQPATLFWIAVGGGAAAWLSQANLTLGPGYRVTARR